MASDDDRHVRPFAEWLLEQRDGYCANELADGLNELVTAEAVTAKFNRVSEKQGFPERLPEASASA